MEKKEIKQLYMARIMDTSDDYAFESGVQFVIDVLTDVVNEFSYGDHEEFEAAILRTLRSLKEINL